MKQFEIIKSYEQIKLLADSRRLAILRKLMAGPATLTQLGTALKESPAWIRHHVKQLESAGLVELVETHITAGVVEKFYRARAGGLLLQELVLPEDGALPSVIFAGSHDLAVELISQILRKHLNLMILPVGSLDGLVSLRQGLCNLSGCHLLDVTGEYNLPYIRHFFPDRQVIVITLAQREQGLMTANGNPKAVKSLEDLARPDIRFINRNPGSGTRIWLDQCLNKLNIPGETIRGYDQIARTHTECARSVSEGRADAALGLHASASNENLGFIPLFHERYDLVVPKDQVKLVRPLLDTLQTKAFRRSVASLIGYDITHTGNQIPISERES